MKYSSTAGPTLNRIRWSWIKIGIKNYTEPGHQIDVSYNRTPIACIERIVSKVRYVEIWNFRYIVLHRYVEISSFGYIVINRYVEISKFRHVVIYRYVEISYFEYTERVLPSIALTSPCFFVEISHVYTERSLQSVKYRYRTHTRFFFSRVCRYRMSNPSCTRCRSSRLASINSTAVDALLIDDRSVRYDLVD